MTEKFFITGLPRSRTAWWSVATTTPVSYCIHEPLKDTDSFESLRNIWCYSDSRFAGVSDSGLAVQLGRILLDIKPRTLIVQRDPSTVMDSLVNYLPWRPIDYAGIKAHIDMSQAAIDEWKDHELVKVVNFDALAYPDIIHECFDWLIPGHRKWFNNDLTGMNIQVDPTTLLSSMADGLKHNQWHLK